MTSSSLPNTPTCTPTSHGAWIGRWLLVVAALHTLATWFNFQEPLKDIVRQGIFDSLGHDPLKGVAVWFFLFGLLMVPLGLAVTALERQAAHKPLKQVAGWILMLCALGVVLMPVSGFWLVVPPAIVLLLRRT